MEILLAANANPLVAAKDGSTAHSEAVLAGRKVVALLIAEASALHAIEMEDSKVRSYLVQMNILSLSDLYDEGTVINILTYL